MLLFYHKCYFAAMVKHTKNQRRVFMHNAQRPGRTGPNRRAVLPELRRTGYFFVKMPFPS